MPNPGEPDYESLLPQWEQSDATPLPQEPIGDSTSEPVPTPGPGASVDPVDYAVPGPIQVQDATTGVAPEPNRLYGGTAAGDVGGVPVVGGGAVRVAGVDLDGGGVGVPVGGGLSGAPADWPVNVQPVPLAVPGPKGALAGPVLPGDRGLGPVGAMAGLGAAGELVRLPDRGLGPDFVLVAPWMFQERFNEDKPNPFLPLGLPNLKDLIDAFNKAQKAFEDAAAKKPPDTAAIAAANAAREAALATLRAAIAEIKKKLAGMKPPVAFPSIVIGYDPQSGAINTWGWNKNDKDKNKAQVIQHLLQALGFGPRKADGKFGSMSLLAWLQLMVLLGFLGEAPSGWTSTLAQGPGETIPTTPPTPAALEDTIKKEAKKRGLDPSLPIGIGIAEGDGTIRHPALSEAGAVGPVQTTPIAIKDATKTRRDQTMPTGDPDADPSYPHQPSGGIAIGIEELKLHLRWAAAKLGVSLTDLTNLDPDSPVVRAAIIAYRLGYARVDFSQKPPGLRNVPAVEDRNKVLKYVNRVIDEMKKRKRGK